MGIEILSEKEINSLYDSGTCFAILQSDTQTPQETYPPDLAHLLSSFSNVFTNPTELPPKRSYDHKITLQPDAKPISVQPYRYPYS